MNSGKTPEPLASEGEKMKSDWQIACEWYTVDEIHRCITQRAASGFGAEPKIPPDVTSREFAEWLTDQYRLAMCKGMQLAKHDKAY